MSGNNYQYDPTEMFKEWIKKSGKAQTEFMKNFGVFMGNRVQEFNPVEALKEITEKASETQTNVMKNFANFQAKGMDSLFNMGQIMPNFLSWGTYKTSVGTNGRISIPEAERDALGLREGDLVQVMILPLAKKSKKTEVKK
jgi:AbrB family looped-hinge helix DNA binding protein